MGSIATSRGRIGVLEQGGGETLPILFLHGVGSDKSVWRPQLDHFGRSRRAIALDYPGYGDSDAVSADATRDDFAAAALAAMDALGLERAHVCGLSLGGVIAIAMHEASPERCASLVLADSFAVHPDGKAIYDRSVEASRTVGLRALAEQRAPLLLAPDVDQAIRDEVIATMAAIDPQAYEVGARAVWLADQRDRAQRIRVPTLVLVGDLDPVTPPDLSRELARLVPGARLEIIAGASHLANLDQAAHFNAAVDAFISAAE
jgi:3-oxoadipate enol-lactonase